MGRLLRGQGDLDGAARKYDQARALEPNRAICHSDIAGLWLDRGNPEEAARSYRVALSLDPRHVEAKHGLGLALLEQGRHAEAEASFREALESSQSWPRPGRAWRESRPSAASSRPRVNRRSARPQIRPDASGSLLPAGRQFEGPTTRA